MSIEFRQQRSSRQAALDTFYLEPGNFVRPEEQTAWESCKAAFWQDLSPASSIEAFFVTEIVHAAWRIRRCNHVEAALINRLSDPALDPMEDPGTVTTQTALDRARSLAEHSLERSLAELRRLQTERQFRSQALPEGVRPANCGVASLRQIAPALSKKSRSQPNSPPGAAAHPLATARNAPCPCGSGQKHKRCCGQNAPAILSAAA